MSAAAAAFADAQAAGLGRVVELRLVLLEHRDDAVRLEDRGVHLTEVGVALPSGDRTQLGQRDRRPEELLHDRVEELVDELAFQYGRSDRDEKALYWLMRAGNRASALFANDEALSFYASALERATTLDRPVAASEIQERIADVQALCSFDLARERSAEEQQRAARLLREVGTALAETTVPRAKRPDPPSFSLAKMKTVSPEAMCLPPYIVFYAANANVSACGSLNSVLIAKLILFISHH